MPRRYDRIVFGPLLSIPEASLVNLAIKIRSDVLNKTSSSGRLVKRICGSHNLVHIIKLDDGFKLVIRIPASGWGEGMTTTAAQAMESQATTIRLVASRTTIPVPEVYALDTTAQNEIGAPYFCMKFIPGRRVTSAWWSDSIPETTLEARRLSILTDLARCMAQLAQFTFPKIGAIHHKGGGEKNEQDEFIIGPSYGWSEDAPYRIVTREPHSTVQWYLEEIHESYPEVDEDRVWLTSRERKEQHGAEDVMDMVFKHVPLQQSTPGFVLAHAHSNNIMVDHEGCITGIIDWGSAQTYPRCMGYSCYPSFITGDWTPEWGNVYEDSAEELERYRRHYNRAMGEAMQWKGDWEYTGKSHIWKGYLDATLHHESRSQVCHKLVKAATKKDHDEDVDLLICNIGEGWDHLRPKLEEQLTAFFTSAGPEEQLEGFTTLDRREEQ